MMSLVAEAMPPWQRQFAPCRENIQHPEIIGLGFGGTGRDVAPPCRESGLQSSAGLTLICRSVARFVTRRAGSVRAERDVTTGIEHSK
jgi:hypothetical protein